MSELKYFTESMVDVLRSKVEDHISWYRDPGGRSFPLPIRPDDTRGSRIPDPGLDKLLEAPNADNRTGADINNALICFENLQALTRHQAAQERFWVHLSHHSGAEYVARRWPPGEKDPATNVTTHFFASTSRNLVRDHGLSRLWWLGKFAYDVEPTDPRIVLDTFLSRQDRVSALFGRTGLGYSTLIVRQIFRVMREHWDPSNDGWTFGLNDISTFKQRRIFREWLEILNRRGGLIMLDALPETELLTLVRDASSEALSTVRDGR